MKSESAAYSNPKIADETPATSEPSSSKFLDDLLTDSPKRLPASMALGVRRLTFLRACIDLGIAPEKRPDFGPEIMIVPEPGWGQGIAISPPVALQLPALKLFYDDPKSWKAKANEALESLIGPYLRKCMKLENAVTESVHNMRFNGKKRNDAIPLNVRYELAASWYCLGTSWVDLKARYKISGETDRIRKAVSAIISALQIPPRK